MDVLLVAGIIVLIIITGTDYLTMYSSYPEWARCQKIIEEGKCLPQVYRHTLYLVLDGKSWDTSDDFIACFKHNDWGIFNANTVTTDQAFGPISWFKRRKLHKLVADNYRKSFN